MREVFTAMHVEKRSDISNIRKPFLKLVYMFVVLQLHVKLVIICLFFKGTYSTYNERYIKI